MMYAYGDVGERMSSRKVSEARGYQAGAVNERQWLHEEAGKTSVGVFS